MLLGDVDLAHVDFTLDAHQRAGRRQRHAVLARTRFGQHLGLAHVFGQQRFAQAVVDLVRAGVVQVFALEMDVRAALALRKAPGIEDRTGPTDVMGVELRQLVLERCRLAHFLVGGVDVIHHGLEFGREDLPSVFAKVALTVGHFQKLLCHVVSLCVVNKP